MRIGSITVKPFLARRIEILERNEAGRPTKRNVTGFTGGFHVTAQVMDCGDGMFQEIIHPAVFKSMTEADAFMDKISRNRLSWNLKNWIIGCHSCNAYQRKNPDDEPLFFCVYNPTPAF